jgi:hypothetical protein
MLPKFKVPFTTETRRLGETILGFPTCPTWFVVPSAPRIEARLLDVPFYPLFSVSPCLRGE